MQPSSHNHRSAIQSIDGQVTSHGLCPQDGDPGEENLKAWGHHRDLSSVPDALMQRMDPAIVSFVFSCQVRLLCPLPPSSSHEHVHCYLT